MSDLPEVDFQLKIHKIPKWEAKNSLLSENAKILMGIIEALQELNDNRPSVESRPTRGKRRALDHWMKMHTHTHKACQP